MLGRLQLGAVGGLEHEPDTIGDGEVLRAVPAGVVELDHGAFFLADANRLGEVSEHGLEHLLADGVGNVPHGSAGGRLDEAGPVQPLEAMMTNRARPIAHRRPHATRYRLQADPMLVRRPDFDRCARMLPLFVGRGLLEFFFKRVAIFIAGGVWMPRSWPLDRIRDGNERIPTTLVVNGLQIVKLGKPQRDLGSTPQAAIIRWRLDPLLQPGERLRREDRWRSSVVDALIAKPIGPTFVVALDQRLHPSRRERQYLGDLS